MAEFAALSTDAVAADYDFSPFHEIVDVGGGHGVMSDLNMLAVGGGRERTEAEYRALLEAAGLKLTRVVPTQSLMSVVEGMRT